MIIVLGTISGSAVEGSSSASTVMPRYLVKEKFTAPKPLGSIDPMKALIMPLITDTFS